MRTSHRAHLSGATIRDTLIGVLRPLSKTQTHVKATGPTKAPDLLPNPEERKGLKEAQHVDHSHPSQARRTISASLEGSGSTLERVTHLRLARGLHSGPSTAQTHLRLARGQRTCPRAGGQSPPRSRTADLPSSGWPISASLEAVSRHKGQTAPPPNRPPYEGIKSQPLRHGSKDGRRQTATPAVDVTGVPSTDPGHRSATPVAVAALWAFKCGTRRVGAAPVTVLPTSTIQTISRWGRGLATWSTLHARAGPRTSLLWGPGPPRAPGPSSVHARTPTRGSGTVPRHYYRRDTAGRPPPSPQDKDKIQDDSDVRRLRTVHFLQY